MNMIKDIELTPAQKRSLENKLLDVYNRQVDVNWVAEYGPSEYRVCYSYEGRGGKDATTTDFVTFQIRDTCIENFAFR